MSLISLNETEEAMELAHVEGMERVCGKDAVAWCNELHTQVEDARTRMWQTAVVLGYELNNIKINLPHGEFGKLFTASGDQKRHNVAFAFTIRQAQRYMDLYRHCHTRAIDLDMGTELSNMLLSFNTHRTAKAAEKLTSIFDKLAPDATSMRQALLSFMREEPEFTKRNELGQIKRAVDTTVLRNQVSQELCRRAQQLGELIESGRYTLADGESRHMLADTCNDLARKLRAVK